MIRYVSIKADQIGDFEDGANPFAFWNTVTDEFVTVCSNQMWEDWNEFEDDHKLCGGTYPSYPIERFRNLMPDFHLH